MLEWEMASAICNLFTLRNQMLNRGFLCIVTSFYSLMLCKIRHWKRNSDTDLEERGIVFTALRGRRPIRSWILVPSCSDSSRLDLVRRSFFFFLEFLFYWRDLVNSSGEARGPDPVRFRPVRVLPSRSDGCNSSLPAEFGEFRQLSGGA
ncbi:hypothetical protein AAC387_Pa11g0279 [Persea americana]